MPNIDPEIAAAGIATGATVGVAIYVCNDDEATDEQKAVAVATAGIVTALTSWMIGRKILHKRSEEAAIITAEVETD